VGDIESECNIADWRLKIADSVIEEWRLAIRVRIADWRIDWGLAIDD
jgi:hypothetical protein